ncbi:hypothetical protein ACFX1Q_040436 [Malus domestica]
MISSVGIDSTVTVGPASLVAYSVDIDSIASRVTGYLSKSRSRRISESLLAENPLSVVTPESTSTTRREKEVGLGGQLCGLEIPNKNTCVLNEGIVEDCDEDGGEGSDPPTRSLLDFSLQLPPKNNLLPVVQAELVLTRLKPIDLEKKGGSSSRTDGPDQRVEVTSVDITEVQWMIDSAMKKGPKFPKFIHPYPAYVERFEYPKGFKILDFSLFVEESSLSSLEHVARFTTQSGDVNNDFHKLRLFNFSLTGSAFA